MVRNRAKIVAAAEVEFRAAGAGVPLDRVAQRAGVGRGTLYRHFPDRTALITAVYTARVDALEAHVATLPPAHLLEHLVAEISAQQVDAPGLFAAVHATHGAEPALADVEARAAALLTTALDEARDRGRVRPGVTDDDVRLLFAMVEGVLAAHPDAVARPVGAAGTTPEPPTGSPQAVATAARRALALALHGILVDAPDTLPDATLPLPGTA